MNKTQIIVLVSSLIVVVIIVILVYKYVMSKKTDDKETTTTTATSSTSGISALSQSGALNAILAGLSDQRYKTSIEPSEFNKDNFMKLGAFNFMYRRADGTSECGCGCGGHDDCDKKIGFIAQDVEKHYPSAIVEDDKGVKYVDYGMMTALNTQAIQEMMREIKFYNSVVKSSQNSPTA